MAAPLDSGDDQVSELHEINVTPFIDVMLVLLIIFMVAAPLSTVDVGVDLPASTAKPQTRPEKPLFLTIKRDLTLALGNEAIAAEQLGQSIDRATAMNREERVFLRADKSVPYGRLMHVMNLLRAAGYLKIALVALEGNDDAPAAQEPAAAPIPGTAQPSEPNPAPR
jgi:biopolymer transport protein ExbD